jgi:hypothetical protein
VTGGIIPPAWVVLVLAALVVIVAAGLLAVWPWSRRWGRANRLHRLDSRNERSLRLSASRALGEAVRALESARRACIATGQQDDGERLGRLLDQVAAVRDRVASDYTPTAANARSARRELSLDCWSASESVGELCVELARNVRSGASVGGPALEQAEKATAELEHQVAPL